MKVELSKEVRIKRDQNHTVLRCIEERIIDFFEDDDEKVLSILSLKDENHKLYKIELEFRKEALKLLRNITPNTQIKIKTQVGKGSTLIQEYTGHIEKNVGHNDSMFNFISPDRNGGNPFSIGLSCLLSIEVLNRKTRIENLNVKHQLACPWR